MHYHYITSHIEGHICHLTLARPEKRNAFTPTMVNEISHAIDAINSDDRITLVLVRSAGPVFCAGMDLKTFRKPELDVPNPAIQNQNLSLGGVFDGLLKPSIAIVEGNVIAGGFLIVLGCTYVYASRDVEFRLPEMELGIFPFQVMASLLKVMPEKNVLQLCLETGYFSAARAMALGIVDAMLDDIDLKTITDRFSKAPARVMQDGIHALRTVRTMDTSSKYTYLKEILARYR